MSFLDLEGKLLDRLKEKVTTARAFLSSADLQGVAETEQITPAVHVVFDGITPTREQGEGAVQEFEQRWVVVAAVRNLREARTGAGVREDASPIIDEVLGALLGWRPLLELSPLKAAVSPKPAFFAGFGYFPFAFTTRVVARGNP